MSTIEPDRPFPRSYWVIPGKLLAGFYPGHTMTETAEQYSRELIRCGIRYVMNLMMANESDWTGQSFIPYAEKLQSYAAESDVNVICERIEISDMDIPSRETMKEILDRIDRALEEEKPVYVHCWGGVGRTGTVVGCYLARHGIAVGDDALRKINELRHSDAGIYQDSPQTSAQREMVMNWKPGE